MKRALASHLRRTLLTGVFAAIPLAVTVVVIVYVERTTREPVKELLGLDVPFIGVLLAVLLIYLLGLLVSSLVGKLLLRALDRALSAMPGLRDIYQAWKQVLVTPGDKGGMYAKVVLVPDGEGERMVLAFTSGEPIPGDPHRCCVFVPELPNPMAGTLSIVPIARIIDLGLSAEEAFKVLLSGGNYIPPEVGAAITRARPAAPPAQV